MDLTYDRLADIDAFAMWCEFCADLGPASVRAAYGAWPRTVAVGEMVWSVNVPTCGTDHQRVGWISLRPDPVAPWVFYAAGIWPAYQRQGLVHRVRAWAQAAVSMWSRVDGLVIEVLDTNAAWQKALIAETERGDLRRAGRVEIPGYEAERFWLPKGAAC